MITARADGSPRRSQNVKVAVVPDCPNGRNDKVARLATTLPADHAE
jgi:hypothetical protein